MTDLITLQIFRTKLKNCQFVKAVVCRKVWIVCLDENG